MMNEMFKINFGLNVYIFMFLFNLTQPKYE